MNLPKLSDNVIKAYLVHLFTASGMIFALLAVWCLTQDIKADPSWINYFFIFSLITIFIDAIDGTLARKFEVKKYAPEIDGSLMDNIIDYITFAFAPCLFILVTDIFHSQTLEFIASFLIIIAATYQFVQSNAKLEGLDHYFIGFPSYWNLLIIYLFWWQFGDFANFAIVLLLVVLSFVPLKWVYPSRTKTLLKITTPLMLIYALWSLYEIIFNLQTPHQSYLYYSYFIFAYYTLLSLYLSYREYQEANKKL